MENIEKKEIKRRVPEAQRKAAIRRAKAKYMMNKDWHCDSCNRTYNLASKWMHMKTQKHHKNAYDK